MQYNQTHLMWNIIIYSLWVCNKSLIGHHCSQAYRQTSHISHTLVDHKIVDHSDVVGASLVGAPWNQSNTMNSDITKTFGPLPDRRTSLQTCGKFRFYWSCRSFIGPNFFNIRFPIEGLPPRTFVMDSWNATIRGFHWSSTVLTG